MVAGPAAEKNKGKSKRQAIIYKKIKRFKADLLKIKHRKILRKKKFLKKKSDSRGKSKLR